MNSFSPSQVVVLGAGPAGMLAALEMSKRHPTTLIAPWLPSPDEPPRVEAVPCGLVALLVELGIHPWQVGVERLYQSRWAAWEHEDLVESAVPVTAHVERPALDLALLAKVVACGRVEIRLDKMADVCRAAVEGARRRELQLIDATGRRAVSATEKMHPTKPWAARTFFAATHSSTADTGLRIAALPGGFVYRLGAANHIVVGVVGRGTLITEKALKLERYLLGCGAGRMLEGLPSLGEMMAGKISSASVQWTRGKVGLRIGDAALGKDTLSSQGLASGISEALYAAAIRNEEEQTLFSLRQIEQWQSHLNSLAHLIARCRFRQEEAWQQYAGFIAARINQGPQVEAALRAGSIRPTSALAGIDPGAGSSFPTEFCLS